MGLASGALAGGATAVGFVLGALAVGAAAVGFVLTFFLGFADEGAIPLSFRKHQSLFCGGERKTGDCLIE